MPALDSVVEMVLEALAAVDFSAREEPDPNTEPRVFFESWLDFQRHEFVRKLRDLSQEQLVAFSIPPVELSVLGLVRHMTQMEHHYVAWGFGGGDYLMVYGEDDYAGGSLETLDSDLHLYFSEVDKANRAISVSPSLDSIGEGTARTLRATLLKMIDEYALHAGQAHMLRFAALGEMIR